MFLNFSIPKSGSTYIHLVTSEYLQTHHGYLTRDQMIAKYPETREFSRNLNLKPKNFYLLVKLLMEGERRLVFRTHDAQLLTIFEQLKYGYSIAYRDPYKSCVSARNHSLTQIQASELNLSFFGLPRDATLVDLALEFQRLYDDETIQSYPVHSQAIAYEKLVKNPMKVFSKMLSANGFSVDKLGLKKIISKYDLKKSDRKTLLRMKSSLELKPLIPMRISKGEELMSMRILHSMAGKLGYKYDTRRFRGITFFTCWIVYLLRLRKNNGRSNI